jgi:prohibitin 1
LASNPNVTYLPGGGEGKEGGGKFLLGLGGR